MNTREKKRAKEKARIVHTLVECEDRANDRSAAARLRILGRAIQAKPPSALSGCDEFSARLGELKDVIGKGPQDVVDLYLSRLETLAEALREESDTRGRFDKMLSKLKNALFGKRETPGDKMLHAQEADAEQKIFALQKKIKELSAQREEKTRELEAKVAKCAELSPDSYEYKTIRQEAIILRPQIGGIEQQLKLHGKLLESNAKYQAMLKNGQTTFALRDYMPDPTKADLLLKNIADQTQEISGDIEAFSKTVEEYAWSVESATPSPTVADDDLFDRMVRETKQAAPTASPATVRERDAASPQAHSEDKVPAREAAGQDHEDSKGEWA